MDNLDKKPEDDAPGDEIESPVEGPTPDWMRLATSAGSSSSSLTEENTPAWLKSIRAGQGLSKDTKSTEENLAAESSAIHADDDTMSDLERLLAEEGIDLGSVAEERPEGAGDMSARDWLIATSSEEIIRNKLGTEPLKEKPTPPPATPQPITTTSNDSMSDLERLLAEEGIDLGEVAEERPEGAEDMSARDWLISTSSEEIIRNKLGTGPLEEKSAAPEPSSTASDDKMVVEDDLPDWLQEVAADVGATEPGFALETSSVVASTPEIEDDQIVVENELPDWLQEIADEAPAAAAPEELIEAPPAPISAGLDSTDEDKMVVEEDLPDWLREVATESAVADEPEPDLPDFSAPSPVAGFTPAPVDEDKMVVGEDLPDWLQDISDESVAAEAEPASVELPPVPPAPKISRPGTAPLNPDKMVVTEDLPDWLLEIADEPAEAEQPEVTDFAEIADVPPTPSAPVAKEDKTVSEEDLPDWLQEAAAEETLPIVEPESTTPLPSSSADKMIVEEDLPDWLREVEVGNTESGPIFEGADLDVTPTHLDDEGDEDLPDWLREVEVSSLENNFLMPPLEASTELPAEPMLTSSLLSEDEFDSLDDEEDLPDWLREVQERDGKDTADDVAKPTPTGFEPASPTAELNVEEGLPDWLREVQEEPETLAFEELEAEAETEQATPEVIENEDLPDWLREVEFDEDEPFEPSEPSPEPLTEVVVEETLVIEDELPDWLQEAQDEMQEEAVADFKASELAPATAATDSTVHLVDEAGLPDWLQDVEEEPESLAEEELAPLPEPVITASVEPASARPVPADVADEEVVETAEVSPEAIPPVIETTPAPVPAISGGIPDWLQKLREVEPEEEQAPAPVFARKAAAPQPVMAEAVNEPEPELPADAEERLKLARTARDKGEVDEAIHIYDSLISRGIYLDKIIEDMQQSIKSHPSNYLLFQVMGDAMMKDGRLQSALNAYREALSKL